ncbi:hypothetical protein GM921_14910 [Pedobacter sp. LMG 31464]|uniref:RteC protein n=1 Tax=Pedobacter planticolens TaxID=2679964 RepID=A0A923IW69_9SPHI|nr:RteC domain-containing protein [Pedobacter planticolens]MBB2146791.1 hypothetical protein [Pedobacter planticolens]
MLEILSQRLLGKLESELEEIYHGEEILQEKTNLSLKKSTHIIGILNNHVNSNGFEDQEQEINYFRITLPGFYSLKIYYDEVYFIELRTPIGGHKRLINFYLREIEIIERFFDKHSFFYGYYKMGATDLDQSFFVLDSKKDSVLLMGLAEVESNTCTSVSYLFAKFKGYELLLLTLKHRVTDQVNGNINFKNNVKSLDKLIWTGEVINLVEIAFGIYQMKQVNNGSAGIGSICRWLGECFDVNLGVPSKRWSEIARRTTMSHTRFMDQMKKSIISKIDDDLARKAKETN